MTDKTAEMSSQSVPDTQSIKRAHPSSRVFWLGMHKLLTRTELLRLRKLGFEVFNPPYLSNVYDQSANTQPDFNQQTTLPRDVFARLMRHNFYYTALPPDIAELLNEYFPVIIVTISMHWLRPIMANYRGKIIFRVYGQHYRLSEEFVSAGLWHSIMSRDNFFIVPFSAESIVNEHTWFIDKCSDVVPYHLDEDVSDYTDTWDSYDHRCEIMVTMPNIDNPYFETHYRIFNDRFRQSYFKLYGVQRSGKPDPRIVGTLDRGELMARFQRASGYYYHFRDQVCYLPPIEMMEIGGPVLYAPGSLLSRFYERGAPGLCRSIFETDLAVRRLLDGDKVFIRELQSAQNPVRDRYRPSTVNPVFDATFTRLLSENLSQRAVIHKADRSGLLSRASSLPLQRILVVALHHNGLLRRSASGEVYAFEGIPRVVDALVNAVIQSSDIHVVITCRATVADVLFDFFRNRIDQGRLTVRVLDPAGLRPVHAPDIPNDQAGVTDPRGLVGRPEEAETMIRLAYAAFCDSLPQQSGQFIPHFYLFPEAALSDLPMMLYLPDYYPHVMSGVVFDSSFEKDRENERVGAMLVKQATFVLTNSKYTAAYLPHSALFKPRDADKIQMLWLPLLGAVRATPLDLDEQAAMDAKVGGGPYIFYPTANRPNKQIAFLLHVLAMLREEYPSLTLVLTGDLKSFPAAADAAELFGLTGSITLLSQVSESSLRWLYENAAALCLTSTIEGNFPPQIREALFYQTPVVATRLPMITEVLGESASELLLCQALDVEDFVGAIRTAIGRREWVLTRQARVLKVLSQETAEVSFSTGIAALIEKLVGGERRQHT